MSTGRALTVAWRLARSRFTHGSARPTEILWPLRAALDCLHCSFELRPYFSRNSGEFLVAGDRHHRHRIDRADDAARVAFRIHNHVARQEASGGLHAPRIMYGLNSTPSFSFSFSRMSISASTPEAFAGERLPIRQIDSSENAVRYGVHQNPFEYPNSTSHSCIFSAIDC